MYLLNDNRISEGNMFRRCNQINIARQDFLPTKKT